MMIRNLDKHKKYKSAYKANDFYWGLGVEHETYLESSKLKQVSRGELKEMRGRERYSVNYYSIYDTDTLNTAIDSLFQEDEKIRLPILVNSHTFQKTDINGEHSTTYERIPKPNPNFSGKTLFEWLKEQNPNVFSEDYDKSFLFDGDTIEFMTQKFYKTTVQNVVDELQTIERDFIRALNSLPREGILKTYAPFQIATKNYPFASYLTNLKNNAMFNNGTIHINITLPTKLDENAEIADFPLFMKQHQNFARVFQWISPLLIAKYGSYDPLCESKTNGELFSAGSQRVAVSRYIGLGTFDTDLMAAGKILTIPADSVNIGWYEEFNKKTAYKVLKDMGLDINFNKHFSHGLEFRIFDSIALSDIHDLLLIIVYLADFSLSKTVENPIKSAIWNKIALECVHNGKGYCMDVSDQNDLFRIFNISALSKEPRMADEVLDIIIGELLQDYKNGTCVQCMINGDDVLRPSVRLSPIPEIPTPQSTPEKEEIKVDIIDTIPENIEIEQVIKPEPVVNVQKKRFWCC